MQREGYREIQRAKERKTMRQRQRERQRERERSHCKSKPRVQGTPGDPDKGKSPGASAQFHWNINDQLRGRVIIIFECSRCHFEYLHRF